jgi:hypothetical protein
LGDAGLNDSSTPAPFGYHELIVDKTASTSVTIIAEPKHADSQKLFAYWKECTVRGGLKLGRDLPAAAVARLMSRLIVFEPVDNNADFRIRLAGTGLLRRFGKDVSGHALSEIYQGGTFSSYSNNLRTTLINNAPLIVEIRITEGPNQLFHIEYVFLPVFSYDGLQPWVVVGVFYFE